MQSVHLDLEIFFKILGSSVNSLYSQLAGDPEMLAGLTWSWLASSEVWICLAEVYKRFPHSRDLEQGKLYLIWSPLLNFFIIFQSFRIWGKTLNLKTTSNKMYWSSWLGVYGICVQDHLPVTVELAKFVLLSFQLDINQQSLFEQVSVFKWCPGKWGLQAHLCAIALALKLRINWVTIPGHVH